MRLPYQYSAIVHTSHHRPLLALALRAVASFLIATLYMLVKLAGQRGVALPEILFWLQFISLPILLAWFTARRKLRSLATAQIGSHIGRALVGMISVALCFAAAQMLSLSDFTALTFTAPLFAVMFSALVLREHVGRWRWGAVICGFIGVIIISRPGSAAIPAIGGICALFAAMTSAVTQFQMRHLGRTDDPVRSVFWYSLFGSILAAGFLPFFGHGHDAATWALLLAIGIVGALVQFTLAASLRHGSVASVIVVDSTQLLWATAYGWAVWNELPMPTLWLGAPMVLLAGAVIAWREHRLSRKMPADAKVGAPLPCPPPGGPAAPLPF